MQLVLRTPAILQCKICLLSHPAPSQTAGDKFHLGKLRKTLPGFRSFFAVGCWICWMSSETNWTISLGEADSSPTNLLPVDFMPPKFTKFLLEVRLNRLKRLLLAKIWPSSVTLCSSFNVAWYQSSCCAGERALALGVVFKGTHIYITTWYGDTSDTLKWILSLHTCLENGQCPFLCVLWVLSPWYVTQNIDDFCAN